MTTQTETLKLSLEALEQSQQILDEYMTECVTARQATNEAITAIKEALAQPEQEPVAWMNDEMDCIFFDAERPDPFDFDFWKPLYTTPPQRKPLDMFEVETLAKQCGLEWSTEIQNLCDMVAIGVDANDISSERVDETDENVHEPVAKVVSTAPKRIWLDLGFDLSDEDEISFNDLVDATWSHDNATGYGIEYVRADATPPQRKPLTDEQREEIAKGWRGRNWTLGDIIDAVEAAHGIKGDA